MKPFEIKKILVPLDFSATSLTALDYALALAKLTKAEIILLHVIENIYVTTDPFYAAIPREISYENELLKISAENLTKAVEKIKDSSWAKVKTLSSTGRTHREIVKVSEKTKSDIIVMGTHGVSGFREFVTGSNTFRVVSDAKCPVLSVQGKGKTVFKNILVPFSDRPHSREKVMYAIKIAGLYGAMLNVLGIDDEKTKAHTKKIKLEAEQINEIAGEYGIKCAVNVVAAPYNANTVLSHAKKNGNDMVVSTSDTMKQDITEYFSGTFSQQIVNHSTIPVLSIHPEFNPETMELWQAI